MNDIRMIRGLNSKQNFFRKQNIMFVGRDEEIAVFDDNGKEFRPSLYFSKEMKQNLGLTSGFPSALI